MEGALLLLGDGPQRFWNHLFTVVFSGGTEAVMSDSGTRYLLGQNKALQDSRFPQGPGQAWSLLKGSGSPSFSEHSPCGLRTYPIPTGSPAQDATIPTPSSLYVATRMPPL